MAKDSDRALLGLGVAFMVLASGPSTLAQTATVVLHVSPEGSDTNPGTAAEPFATLERARDAVRALKRKGLPAGGVTVRLRGGQYRLRQTFRLTPEDAGTAESPIRYEAFAGEKPVLSGGRPIVGWRKLAEDVPGLCAAARGKLWVADVPKGWRFHYLYVNGVAQQVARRPNHDDVFAWPDDITMGKPEPAGQLLTFPPGTLEDLPSNGDVEIIGCGVFWNGISVLKEIDAGASTARRHSRNPVFGKHYCLCNALALLDQPGEWCVDSTGGRVYYWPPDGVMAGKQVIAPGLCELVRFQGVEEKGPWVHHVVLRGLTFRYTDRLGEDRWPESWLKRNGENQDAAIFLQGVHDCTIEGNTIRDVGTYAVALDHHAQRVRVVGNEMANLGCGGVQMYGYGPGTTDVNKDNVVTRNHIHHIGLAPYWHAAAITLYGSGSNEISYNFLHDLPYAGISIAGVPPGAVNARGENQDAYGHTARWYACRADELPKEPVTRDTFRQYLHSGNNVIRRNIISQYMMKLGDGGALYAWWCGAGNRWTENVLRRAPEPRAAMATLYMDDGVDEQILERNVVWSPGHIADKGENKWVDNELSFPQKPAGFDAALVRIADEVQRQGGWPGDPLPALYPITVFGKRKFYEPTTVWFDYIDSTAVLRYTTDGSEPRANSPRYTAPFQLDKTTAIHVAAFAKDGRLLRKASADFTKWEPVPYTIGRWLTGRQLMDFQGVEIVGSQVWFCDDGKWVRLPPFDFGPAPPNRVELLLGVHPEYSGGRRAIEFRLEKPDGPPVGSLAPRPTGGWRQLEVQSTPIAIPPGVHVIVVRFKGHAVCNLAKWRFLADGN